MPRAGMEIRFDSGKLRRHLERAARVLKPRAILKLIGMDLLHFVGENFKKGGIEKKWDDLAPSTKAGRRKGRKKGKGPKPLRDTGPLEQSFIQAQQGNVFDLDDVKVTVGTELEYASPHEHGTGPFTIRAKRAIALKFIGPDGSYVFAKKVEHPGIPQRKMLPSEKMAKRIALKTINEVIARGMRGLGEKGGGG